MKGNANVIEQLNLLLADELTAVNQYILHSEMCANWGYEQLHQGTPLAAIPENKHLSPPITVQLADNQGYLALSEADNAAA